MLAYVTSSGWDHVDAVLWHQGECDAQESTNLGASDPVRYAAYKAALENLADAVERDLSAPLVVAPISLRWCRHTNPTRGDVSCDPATHATSDWKRAPIHDATIDAAAGHRNIETSCWARSATTSPTKTGRTSERSTNSALAGPRPSSRCRTSAAAARVDAAAWTLPAITSAVREVLANVG